MTVLDDETDVGLSPAEGSPTVWSPPQASSRCRSRDFRARYERERARADAAETRCEELRQAEREARSRAGTLKWNLDKSRDKLKAAAEEVKEVRRTAKNALGLQAEVTRLEKLLAQAGICSSKRSTIMSLRMEVAHLRAAAAQAGPRAAPRRPRNPEEKIASLRGENDRLKTELRAAKDRAGTVKFLERELDNHRYWLRGCHDEIERLKARHRDEVDWLNQDIARLRQTIGHWADSRLDEMALLRKRHDRRLAAAKRLLGAREGTIAWLRERNDRLRAAVVRAKELIASLREKNARLFETTPYGISVWACMLYERFVCLRPLCRVAAWMADMGLAISPGTLADSTKRFVPLFEPLAEAILAHQNEAALRHADETSWRVQEYREKGRSNRAWLWISVSHDAVYFVDRPFVPMDNNRGELELRSAVIGRRLSFGSDSETGAGFTATMYSVARTLEMNGIDVRRWLREWLTACAENGGKPPDDLKPWLPWSMSEERSIALMAPG